MTESRARRDLDFAYELDDPDNDGWYGRAQAEPASTLEAEYVERDESPETGRDYADPEADPDTDTWYLPAQPAEPARDADHNGWDEPRESRWDGLYAPRTDRNGAPRIGEWTFSVSRPEPWYRSKHVRTALIAAAVALIAVPVVLLAMRSPATGTEESTTVPPQPPTNEPAPTSTAPALSTAMPPPPAPPPPPPPPPPPAETGPEPVITRQYPQPRQSAPEQTGKPEIGVTRTPATRMPISAKPPPPPPRSDRNSSTPGDAPDSGGGWGW